VTSDQFGRLLTLRVRGQNNVIVNLPGAMRRGDRLTLRVVYGGHLPPHQPDREVAAVAGQAVQDFVLEPEPRSTYSNRSWWYPQTPVSTYAPARMRITVPAAFTVIGSGVGEAPESVEGPDGKMRRVFVFKATQPVRYLAFVVARLDLVKAASVVRPGASQLSVSAGTRLSRLRNGVFYEMTDVEVWTQRRQANRAGDLLDKATAMVRFYQDIVDDAPYPVLRVVAVEDTVPGGHSPAYFALLHQPLPVTPFTWGRDPVAFDNYPDFFLAHEIAHQFWGQAVGWESYHEQWISEAFAQYFAAMYAEKTRPADTFVGILRQMHRSALDAGPQGPVWLGYRLGHLKNDGRVFRAIVYNKGALVLHMLRRVVGDDTFTRGLQRFYGVSRFRRVGTDDLRAAFEYESGRPLDLFFERWIHEADVPTLQTSWSVDDPMTSNGGALSGNGASPVVRVRIQQDATRLYILPLTVTVVFADGSTERAIAQIEGETTDLVVPVTRPVRDVRFNDDYAALARIERARR
jgi:aminopeptidase N